MIETIKKQLTSKSIPESWLEDVEGREASVLPLCEFFCKKHWSLRDIKTTYIKMGEINYGRLCSYYSFLANLDLTEEPLKEAIDYAEKDLREILQEETLRKMMLITNIMGLTIFYFLLNFFN